MGLSWRHLCALHYEGLQGLFGEAHEKTPCSANLCKFWCLDFLPWGIGMFQEERRPLTVRIKLGSSLLKLRIPGVACRKGCFAVWLATGLTGLEHEPSNEDLPIEAAKQEMSQTAYEDAGNSCVRTPYLERHICRNFFTAEGLQTPAHATRCKTVLMAISSRRRQHWNFIMGFGA